jgi:hypothetical protein
MIIEQNTNYAYKLKYMENPTFNKVRDLAIKFMRELPKQLQDELYEALNRGIDILDSEPQMVTYLYAFGPMHQAKLNYAFKHMPIGYFYQPQINIIDYGCGQAMGTMCYADYLRDNGCSQKIKTITLIEPSEMCLKRAALHSSVFFPDAKIVTVNKKFDDLTNDDIVCSEDIPTLHILSNVLDVTSFNLIKFSKLIKSQLKGNNQFICVGPYFKLPEKDNRLKAFQLLLNGKVIFHKCFDYYEFLPDKTCTAQMLFCVVNLLNERITVTDKKPLKQLVIEQNSEVKFVNNPKTGKLFFICGKIRGYVSPAAAKRVQDSDCTLEDFEFAMISKEDGVAIPCIMLAPNIFIEKR